IRVVQSSRVVYTDVITGAQTTHYSLEIDLPSKAVSFEDAEEVRQRRGGAFMRHKKNGHFVLAIESGRHTDPATGNSYRTFALWKPEAPHANYIHDDELNEKYKAVTPDRARNWWTQKHATVPAIETVETHIIGGAIIPLWQRFKAQEDTRQRVGRGTAEDRQRIVGVHIPSGRGGAGLRWWGHSS